MKLRPSCLLCWLALGASLSAQPTRRLMLQSVPPDVVAVAERASGNQTFLHNPVELVLEDFPGQTSVVLWLSQNGYEPLRVEVPLAELQADVLNRFPSRPGSLLKLAPRIVPVTFHTSPEGARIYLRELNSRLTPLLHPSGEVNYLNLASLLGSGQQSQITVVFECPYFYNATFPVSVGGGEVPARLPAEGSIPLSARAPVLSSLALAAVRSGHPWLAAGSLLGLLVLLGTAARRRRLRPVAQIGIEQSTLRIPHFTLGERIGSGGMSDVYRATADDSLEAGEAVAIKVLKLEQQDADEQRRFLREIQISKDLAHANLVRLFDWGTVGERLYLVMELLEGMTLRERLRQAPMPAEEAVSTLEGVAAALWALHQKGVIHRDVKPENIFLTVSGKLKLMDFGISISGDYTQLTATGVFLGTPAYIAPEQVQGRAEIASDQYSLGVLAFELLVGRRPFDEADPLALAYSQVNKAAPAPTSLRPDLPVALDSVLMKMLDKRPQARYANVLEAAKALRAALGLTLEDDEQKTGAW